MQNTITFLTLIIRTIDNLVSVRVALLVYAWRGTMSATVVECITACVVLTSTECVELAILIL